MRRIVVASVAVFAAFATASGTTAAKSKSHVGRAFADAYVQVEQDATLNTEFPQRLGIAHIKVRAYDFDPSHPQDVFEQQPDQVSLSCAPVSGTNPCAGFPQGQKLLFVDHDPANPSFSSIAMLDPGSSTLTFLTLNDGGAPGNGATGETTSLGTSVTKDWIRWTLPGSDVSWSGYLLSGHVTIKYAG